MPHIDLYSLIEANANLARDRKELLRLVSILTETIKEMATATEIYSEGMTMEAMQYRATPKGLLCSLRNNRMIVDGVMQRSRQSALNVENTMRELCGGFDDATAAKAFYDSLIDEMKHHNTKKQMDWLNAFRGPDGKWYFTAKGKKASDFYNKNKKDIEKFLNDISNQFPPGIDPKNMGGDFEGEWQDGPFPPEEED